MGKANKKNWEMFEELAYLYISDKYKKSIIEKTHTIPSHDNGYDGIWLVNREDSLKNIIMEAKYRKTQKSLPLSDCAKAIIIAFNMNVDTLYIASNIMFAPQTKKEVNKFQIRSRLMILCISRMDFKKFIQEKKEFLVWKIDESFLNEILDSVDDTFDNSKKSIIDNSEQYIQDDNRTELIKSITNIFQSSNTCIMLKGNEGVGKTILSKMVSYHLIEKDFDSNRIDLSLCTSSRILYIKVLEGIWGISLTPILEDESIRSYIDSLVNVNKNIDESISSVVKGILTSSYYEFNLEKDKYLYLLLKYIEEIMVEKKYNLRLLLIFENLHMASKEVLFFLFELINCLKKNSIRILLEVRSPFLLNGDIETEDSNNCFTQLNQISDQSFILEAVDQEVAATLIESKLKISRPASLYLANLFGNNFLEIQGAIEVLNHDSSFSCEILEQIGNSTEKDFEKYWNDLGLSSNAIIISLILKLRKKSSLSEFFELAYLFDGKIPYVILHKAYGNTASVMIETAVECTVFIEDEQALICKHIRFLKAIEATKNSFLRYRMATEILPIIQKEKNINPTYPFVELNLLYLLNKNSEIPIATLHVISLYMGTFQYKQALETANQYIKSNIIYDSVILFDDNTYTLKILMKALLCLRELHEENNSEFEYLYDKVYIYITVERPELLSSEFWCQYQLCLWHKEFVAGNFSKAMEISQVIYNGFKESLYLFDRDEDYAGQVHNAYGLSIKMLYGGDQAEAFFEKGVEEYPDSYYLRAALLSQIGNQLLKTNPRQAALKYNELLITVKGKEYPFQEILHTRIDKAMAYLLAGEIDESIICSNECKEIASTIGIHAQTGRALNILGCCQIAKGLHEDSIKTFEKSIFFLKLAKANIYEWRACLNLASVLLHTNSKEKAMEKVANVQECLLTNFIVKIKSDKKSVPYQALLLIMMYLHDNCQEEEVKEIILQVSEIEADYLNLSNKDKWKEHFSEKVICFENTVLVTG